MAQAMTLSSWTTAPARRAFRASRWRGFATGIAAWAPTGAFRAGQRLPVAPGHVAGHALSKSQAAGQAAAGARWRSVRRGGGHPAQLKDFRQMARAGALR